MLDDLRDCLSQEAAELNKQIQTEREQLESRRSEFVEHKRACVRIDSGLCRRLYGVCPIRPRTTRSRRRRGRSIGMQLLAVAKASSSY